jgi:site-specific DNA-methyltransferase (adenine-specific)
MKIEEYKYGKVIYADCMNEENGLPTLEDNSFDVCIVDPPYGIDYDTNYYKNKNEKPAKINNDDKILTKWIKEIYRILKDDSAIICFTRHDVLDIWKKEISKYFKYKNTLIWVKNNWSAGDLFSDFGNQYECMIYAIKGKFKFKGKRHPNVFFANRIPPKKYNHLTPKPIKLLKEIIECFKPESIIDPFLGSGSIAEISTKLGILFLGYEINEDCSVDIQKRLKNCRPIEKQYTNLLEC